MTTLEILLLILINVIFWRIPVAILALLTYPIWGLPRDLYVWYKENKEFEEKHLQL